MPVQSIQAVRNLDRTVFSRRVAFIIISWQEDPSVSFNLIPAVLESFKEYFWLF